MAVRSPLRFVNTKNRVSIDVLERKVYAMRSRVDRDRVDVGCAHLSHRLECRPAQPERGHDAPFSRDIETSPGRVPCEDIRTVGNLERLHDLHGAEVNHQ